MKPENIEKANLISNALKHVREQIKQLENDGNMLIFNCGGSSIYPRSHESRAIWTYWFDENGPIIQQLIMTSDMARQNLLAIMRKAETDLIHRLEEL